LLCGYQRDVSNLVTVNNLGQVKVKGQIATGQKMYTDVRVSPAN